jgi:membrane protease YdiL (CAAX protease family)
MVPVLMHFGASFVLLGLSSLFAMRWLLRRPLSEFGLRVGEVRFWWRGALLSFVVFAAPSVFGGSALADVGAEYPLAKAAASSLGVLGAYGIAYGIYYIAWEVHFRGFILFGLAPKLGVWPAIFCQTVPSVLIHAGKPPGETFAAIIAGVVWGWLAIESRSILGPLLAHWALGVTNDLAMSVQFHGLHLW